MEIYENMVTRLSDLVGIIPEYYDIFGRKHVLSKESRVAILRAMDLRVDNADEVRSRIEEVQLRPWLGMLDPVSVISVNSQPHRLAVHVPLPDGSEQTAEFSVTIRDEAGGGAVASLSCRNAINR